VSKEPLIFAAKNLLGKLEKRLQKNLHTALEMNLFFETEYCEEIEIRIPLLRPLRREKALLHVIRERIYSLTLSAPLLSFSIEMSLPVRDRGSQFHLFDAGVELIGGLGPTMISAAVLRERYRPERSWEPAPFEPFQHSKKETLSQKSFFRPTHLLPSPKPLQMKQKKDCLVLHSQKEHYEIISMKGPERIVGEWWDGGGHSRDYFCAETKEGAQLWIFKPLSKTPSNFPFYLHGYFD